MIKLRWGILSIFTYGLITIPILIHELYHIIDMGNIVGKRMCIDMSPFYIYAEGKFVGEFWATFIAVIVIFIIMIIFFKNIDCFIKDN